MSKTRSEKWEKGDNLYTNGRWYTYKEAVELRKQEKAAKNSKPNKGRTSKSLGLHK